MRSRTFVAGPVTGPAPLSELGFGCSAVAGRSSRTESLRALHAAFDAGITFFDTARSYGYGQSEAVVGEFLHGRRQSLVLCTKFGILPAPHSWKQKLKPAARAAVRLFPGLRQAARRQAGDQFAVPAFTVAALRSSFETSLRELKSDYVDMLLLHAAPASVLGQEDLLEAMAAFVTSGKVLMAGISGELPVIEQYFRQRPPQLGTAQFALNLATLSFADQTRRNADLLLVGNHPFGGPEGAAAGRTAVARLRERPDLPAALREKLDPADPQTLPELVLNSVVRDTGLAAVVPAMMQVSHIQSNIRALEHCRFTAEELAVLRSHLATPSGS